MSGYNLFRAAGVSLLVALLAAIAMSIGGCSGSITGSKTGLKTTNYTNGEVSSVQEEQLIGDKYTGYGNTIEKSIGHVARGEADAIKAIAQVNAPKDGDSEIMAMAKAAISSLSIVAIKAQNRLDLIVNNIKYGKDGYDVADTIAGGFVNIIGNTVPWLAAANMVRNGYQAAGDKTETNVQGDGNYVELKQDKVHINSNINATGGSGDGSYSTVPYAPSTTNASPVSETINEAPETPVVAE